MSSSSNKENSSSLDPSSSNTHSGSTNSAPTPLSSGSGSQSIASTKPLDSDYQDEITDNIVAEGWGSLTPINPAKHNAFNLRGEDDISFGRLPGLSYVFIKSTLSNQEYLNISKKHFIIKKSGDKIEVKDLSSNGTFINGQLIGKGNSYPLTHLARIAMGLPNFVVFTFVNTSERKLEEEKMPSGFKMKYCLEDFILGEGATGCVKKCFLKNNPDKKFAVKIMKKGRSFLNIIKDFSYESNILSTVNHKNIVNTQDFYENDHSVYMVMEYVRGGELFNFIKSKGAVTESKAKDFFQQLLEGVAYLHDNDITHRDLKPENILLDDEVVPSVLKIADFGLSRFVSETSLMETLVGTPSYLAPEILDPTNRGYTKKVDSWSLGCVLYIILGGYPPFSNEDPELDLHNAILNGAYTFHEERWRDISEEAKDLVRNRLSVQDALKHPFVSCEVLAKRRKSN